MPDEAKLSLNVLYSLLIQAKKHGKGMIGNGRLIVMLLRVIADSDASGKSKERQILQLFSDEPVKSRAYQRIDKQLLKFIPTGKPYPYEKLTFSSFSKAIGTQDYYAYLKAMDECCATILDQLKAEALTYTLLELLRADERFSHVLYGEKYIPKIQLIGSPAHPKRICFPALILGLLYQTHQFELQESDNQIALLKTPQILYFYLANNIHYNCQDIESLQHLLQPDASPSTAQIICYHTSKINSFSLPEHLLPLEYSGPEDLHSVLNTHHHILLTGEGGIGKSTAMMQFAQHQANDFYLALYQYKETKMPAYEPANSHWILQQILLRYFYQGAYSAFETCIAIESEATVLRRLHELETLLMNCLTDHAPQFTILLDGINEIQHSERESFYAEISQIYEKWTNCKIVVSDRTVPMNPVFCKFKHISISGIATAAESDSLLRIPLFLQICQTENTEQPMNRAKMIEAYVRFLCSNVRDNIHRVQIQYLTKYVLPLAAYQMQRQHSMTTDRASLSEAIKNANEIYLHTDRIYQNLLFPQGVTKQLLPSGIDTDTQISWLTEHLCILHSDRFEPMNLMFSHQYYRDYFSSRHILNLMEAINAAYPHGYIAEKAALFEKLELGQIWFDTDDMTCYQLLGELCGDDLNVPCDDFVYQKTMLDELLDMSRQFDTFRTTENVMHTMAATRGNVICGTDFSETHLPLWIPAYYKFSNNGKDPCRFSGCKTGLFGLLDGNISVYYSDDLTCVKITWQDGYTVDYDLQNERILAEAATEPLYTKGMPISEIDSELMKHIFSKLSHFRGCDFDDAVFLTDEARNFFQEMQ